jgi:H+/Cl- antiporter ClcA
MDDGIKYVCPEGYYNPLSTLLFNPLSTEFRLLMDSTVIFSYQALMMYFTVWYLMTILTYGTNVPAGCFVSGILIGCSFGRLWAMFCTDYLEMQVHVPSYALIGAVSILAGYARHTFSLAVIMMESTENINLFLPMIFSMFISYSIAGIYNRSIYLNSLRSKNIPWLVESIPV